MNKARERSIDNLQRLYTVVVSLAIAESLRRLLSDLGDKGCSPAFPSVVAVFCLLVTIVPFYHGANRYIDSAYVSGNRSAKSGALMFDFVAIFVEAIILFVLALLIRNFELFFDILSILFIFDAIWVASTYLTGTGEGEKSPPLKWWLMMNLSAALLVFVSIRSNALNWSVLFPFSTATDIAVIAVVTMRSILDYLLL